MVFSVPTSFGMTLGALPERTVVAPSFVVNTTPAFVASAMRLAKLSSIA